ncbi:MAG: DHHW family protein [Eubacteriales bacterium]|nr:DHHW family protein [Eubacteriales bacterium]
MHRDDQANRIKGELVNRTELVGQPQLPGAEQNFRARPGARPRPQNRGPRPDRGPRRPAPEQGPAGRPPNPRRGRVNKSPGRSAPQYSQGEARAPGARTRGRRAAVHLERKAARNLKLALGTVLGFLLIFQLLYLLLPKASESKLERRSLASFPKLSAASFLEGSWHREVENYLNDHVPFRQLLISVDRAAKRMLELRLSPANEEQIEIVHGKRERHDEGNQIPRPEHQAAVPSPDSSQAEAAPNTAPSESEKAKPDGAWAENKAELNLEHTEGELAYESYSVVIKGVQGMEIFNYSPELWTAYAGRLNHLRSKLPEEIKMYSLIAPTAIAFYGPETYRVGAYSSLDAIKQAYSEMSPGIIKCDAYSYLSRHSSEYIYFRTDHHWTGLGAYYAYQSFCAAAGLQPTELSQMKKTSSNSFLGTIYSYSDQSPVLAANPDYCEYYHPVHMGSSTVSADESFSETYAGTLMSPEIYPDYPYLGYSGGDVAINKLSSTLEGAKKERIAVLKDSFGNALAPYLMDNFAEVYIIDPRVFTGDLIKFLKANEINNLLVVNYSFACSNPLWAAGFDLITGYQPAN